MKYENKQYELWEHMTYVICEVLAWRGIWLSEERRRVGNVDVGRAEYLGLPYYGRWLLAAARILVEKHHIGLTELSERMIEVKARYDGGLDGKKLEANPKSEGDGSQVKRNEHHKRAVGKGDPQVYAGQAGQPQFKVGDAVVVRELPVIFYTRTPEYVRGAKGEIAAVAYESPAAEDETWDRPRRRNVSTSLGSLCPTCDTATPEPPMTSFKPKFPNIGCKPPNKLRRKDSHD